jgi:transcriptional regulator with XRE-family HTH domain
LTASDESGTISVAVSTQSEVSREPIGERLRRLRSERGLSQRRLACPGVSYAYISRIEAGARTPSVKALRKLAGRLGVSPEYLETGSEIGEADERELRLAQAELALRLDGPEAARTPLGRVVVEADQAGDARAAVRARIGVGLAAARSGAHAEAVRVLEEAIAAGGVSPNARPDAYAALAGSLRSSGAADRAVELLERAVAEVGRQGRVDVAALALLAGELAAIKADAGELEDAESLLRKALDTPVAENSEARSRALRALARQAVGDGRPLEALAALRRALAHLDVSDDTRHLAGAQLLLARVLQLQGRTEEAASRLESAEQLLGATPDPADLAAVLTERARLAAHAGRAEEAVARATRALELLGDESPRATRGNAWWALAEGLEQRGDLAGSRDAFRRAVDLLGRPVDSPLRR